MELRQFYDLVLPDTGFTCIFEKHARRHHWSESLAGLRENTERMALSSPDWYYATGSFRERNRRQKHVLLKKALYLDVDAGLERHAKHPGATYPTVADAEAAVETFVKATRLEPSVVVSSGQGLHLYWALEEPVSPETWQPMAVKLQRLADAQGLRTDRI
jgi:hypothetical protein